VNILEGAAPRDHIFGLQRKVSIPYQWREEFAARLEAMGTEKYRSLAGKSRARTVWTGAVFLDRSSQQTRSIEMQAAVEIEDLAGDEAGHGRG